MNADEARQPVRDDGESLIIARSASLLSETRTHAHIGTHTHLLSNMMNAALMMHTEQEKKTDFRIVVVMEGSRPVMAGEVGFV